MTIKGAVTAFAVLAAVSLGTAHANLLVNGSFEAVSAQASPFYLRSFASTPGWTQYANGVDLIHNNYTQGPAVLVDASDGVQFLDMNQAGSIGGLYQLVSVTPGLSYRLELDTTAWATNARGGTIGYELYDGQNPGSFLVKGSYTDATGGTWIRRSLDVVAPSALLGVRIYGIYAAQAGMGLDNVVLSAVPEPRSLALMLAGLAAVGFVARRRGGRMEAGRKERPTG